MEFITCLYCHKKYKPDESNTKIHGLYIEIVCPHCYVRFEGKLLNFVDRLCGSPRAVLKGAALMQKMAQMIDNSAVTAGNKGKPGKEKKKPTKDKKDDKKKKK